MQSQLQDKTSPHQQNLIDEPLHELLFILKLGHDGFYSHRRAQPRRKPDLAAVGT